MGFRCSALLNDELAPYTRSPSTVPRVYSVHQKPVFYTEFPFGTVEACFLHRVPQKTRRVHQGAFFSTECIFRTPEAPLLYRMPDARKEEPLAGTEQGGGFSGEMLFGRRNEPKVAKCPVDWRLTRPNSPFLCLLTSERGPFRALKLLPRRNFELHKRKRSTVKVDLLWELRESNPRPSACKADALNQLS